MNGQVRGVEQNPHLAADKFGGHRVPVGSNGDLGVAIHPRSEPQSGLERLHRKWFEQMLFRAEGLTDSVGAVSVRWLSSARS